MASDPAALQEQSTGTVPCQEQHRGRRQLDLSLPPLQAHQVKAPWSGADQFIRKGEYQNAENRLREASLMWLLSYTRSISALQED